MEVPGIFRNFVFITASIFAFSASATSLYGQERTVELNPAQTNIEFTLGASLHTVHGSFQLKSGTINFDPAAGTASGMVIVDATSADTGNKSRDKKMHREVLESGKFPEVIFRPNKIARSLSSDGSSTVQLEGVFRLHGDDHTMNFTIPVQITGDAVIAKMRFIIPYVAWGLKNPSTFLLHVSDKVQVDVTTTGHFRK